jgi:hypothetical protein
VQVETNHGPLTGDQVVVATHYPVRDRGLYFARMDAVRAYCVAARVRGLVPLGMSITSGSPSWSYQSSRRPGDRLRSGPAGGRARCRQIALRRPGGPPASALGRRKGHPQLWSAQDAMPYDHTPMIGTCTPVSRTDVRHCGLLKMGSDRGHDGCDAADRADQPETQQPSVFSPHRFSPRGLPQLAQLQSRVALGMIGDRLIPGQASAAAEVPVGEARVVRSGTDRTGVYRDACRRGCTRCRCAALISAAWCGSTPPRQAGTAPATGPGSTWTARCWRAQRSTRCLPANHPEPELPPRWVATQRGETSVREGVSCEGAP